MGSLAAMEKGSDTRYLGDKSKLKISQGVSGVVADKGFVLRLIPYTMCAVKQGFQDLGVSSLQDARNNCKSGVLRLEGEEQGGRQAFQRSLAASIWSVEDSRTDSSGHLQLLSSTLPRRFGSTALSQAQSIVIVTISFVFCYCCIPEIPVMVVLLWIFSFRTIMM